MILGRDNVVHRCILCRCAQYPGEAWAINRRRTTRFCLHSTDRLNRGKCHGERGTGKWERGKRTGNEKVKHGNSDFIFNSPRLFFFPIFSISRSPCLFFDPTFLVLVTSQTEVNKILSLGFLSLEQEEAGVWQRSLQRLRMHVEKHLK